MNCFDETELVIEYMEEHILSIEFSDISKLVGIPIGLYQRLFKYISGISISEYVKKRKLSLAAIELQSMENKIIDIALKYGYESHASFTRAFRDQFGFPPSDVAYKDIDTNLFHRLSFNNKDENYRIVKGKKLMAELVKIEYEDYGERKLIGIENKTDFSKAGFLWREYFETGACEKLSELNKYLCRDIDDYIGLGYMCDFDETGNKFTYTIGKYFTSDTPVPNGYASKIIPGGTIAKAQISGTLDDILYNAYFLITEAIAKNGYKVDYQNFYWCDVYTFARYCNPSDIGEKILILDYFMPCKKDSEQ